MKSTVQVLW